MNIIYKSIILRAIEKEDLEFCREMINSPGIEMSTVGKNLPISREQQMEWFQKGNKEDEIRFLIEVKEIGLIGMAMLTDIHWVNRSAEVGLKLTNKLERSTKNTFDLCECLLRYCFDELNLHSLYAYVLEDNILSRKLLTDFGFNEDGVLRQRVFKRGKYHNLFIYSLTEEEYRK